MRLKMYRSHALIVCCVLFCAPNLFAWDGQTRPSANDEDLKSWLQNMSWHHRYTSEEMQQVTCPILSVPGGRFD
ncbi:MAG: hypothetical protein P8J37_22895 [Fuerstiella sp.]|nr:hypothetical protein [Fuerstiella sp.]